PVLSLAFCSIPAGLQPPFRPTTLHDIPAPSHLVACSAIPAPLACSHRKQISQELLMSPGSASQRLNVSDSEASSKIFWIRNVLSATSVLECAICCCLVAEIAEYWLSSLIHAAKRSFGSGRIGVASFFPQVPVCFGPSRPGATPLAYGKTMKFARHVIKYQRFRAISDANQTTEGEFSSDA